MTNRLFSLEIEVSPYSAAMLRSVVSDLGNSVVGIGKQLPEEWSKELKDWCKDMVSKGVFTYSRTYDAYNITEFGVLVINALKEPYNPIKL